MSEETKNPEETPETSTPETPNSSSGPESVDEATGQEVKLEDAAPVEEAKVPEETADEAADAEAAEADAATPPEPEMSDEEKAAQLEPEALRADLNKLDASLNAFAQAYNQTVQNFNGLQQQVMQGFAQFQGWIGNAEGTLNNHNIRVNVLETLLVHPDFVMQLVAAIGPAVKEVVADTSKELPDRLTIADLHKIAKEHVMPALKAQYEKAVAEAKKAQEEAKAKQARDQTGLVDAAGNPVSSQDPQMGQVVDMAGRPLTSEPEEGPQTVGLDDDD